MLNRLVGDRGWENYVNWLIPSVGLRVNILAEAMVKDAEKKLDNIEEYAKTHEEDPEPVVTYVTGNASITDRASG